MATRVNNAHEVLAEAGLSHKTIMELEHKIQVSIQYLASQIVALRGKVPGRRFNSPLDEGSGAGRDKGMPSESDMHPGR